MLRLCALLLIFLGVGCGQGPGGPQPTPKVTVVLADGAYIPDRVEIVAGSRVTFVNRAQTINTAESPGVGLLQYNTERLRHRGQFDTHVLYAGEAESVRFDRPGTYPFLSSLDGLMHGTIVVRPRADSELAP